MTILCINITTIIILNANIIKSISYVDSWCFIKEVIPTLEYQHFVKRFRIPISCKKKEIAYIIRL